MTFFYAIFVKLIILYLIVLVVNPSSTSAACTVKRNGVDIANTVSGDVATCDGDIKCGKIEDNDVSIIVGCRLVMCSTYKCVGTKITNSGSVVCNEKYESNTAIMSNVKNVTCSAEGACGVSVIETIVRMELHVMGMWTA